MRHLTRQACSCLQIRDCARRALAFEPQKHDRTKRTAAQLARPALKPESRENFLPRPNDLERAHRGYSTAECVKRSRWRRDDRGHRRRSESSQLVVHASTFFFTMFTSRLAVLFAAASTLLVLIRVELFATRQQPPVSTICGKLWKNQHSPGGSLHEVSGGAVHARTTPPRADSSSRSTPPPAA
jgi:hypothetical protein